MQSSRQQRAWGGRWLAVCALGGVLLGTGAVHGQALTPYDSFTGTYIQPTRWYGAESEQYGGTRTEARRAIQDGQLRIESRGYSDQYSDVNASTVRNALYFAAPGNLTAIRATLTPRSYVAGKCTANTTPTVVRGRLFGFFFSAGDPQPGSSYNDVYAGIQVYRASNSTDASNVLRVSAFIGQCTDDNCISSTTLASQEMGTTTQDTPIQLQLTWDGANNRFRFQRDSQALVDLSYTVADTKKPSSPSKRLEVSNSIAHCTASRPVGSFAVDFDDVQTNAVAAAARVAPTRSDIGAAIDPLVGHVN